MEKLYSGQRWSDNPKPVSSLCGKCKHWIGFGKCNKYSPVIPQEILNKSFQGTADYDSDYCPYRSNKDV